MNANVGARTLLRLALRRDRVMIPVWIAVLAVFVLTTAASYAGLYDTAASRQEFTEGINSNASTLAFYGQVHGDSVGALTAWRMGAVGSVLVAIMSVLLVVRHTRAEEEQGRLELVSAGVVGRYAPLTVALITALIANLVLGVLVALGLTGQGAAGAVLFALGWALTGVVFAGVAAVAAQVTETARTANGLSIGVLALAFLLRAAGDAGGSDGPTWLTWLSPIGWVEQLRPYSGDRWWVLVLPLMLAGLLIGSAYRLVSRRDLGAGLIPSRPGPATASPRLRSPLALAWRLQRGTLLAWLGGFAVYGLIMGGVAKGVGDLVSDTGARDAITRMGGQDDLTKAYLATAFGLMSLIASVYAVQATLRMRSEEVQQRLEPLLALPVDRIRWAAGHLLIALCGAAALMAVSGLTVGLAYGAATSDVGGKLPEMLGGALVQVPAAWVLAAIAVALFGLVPQKAAAGAWGAITVFLVLGQMGPVLKLDQWAMDLSPFTHVPKLPGGAMTATPLIWLTALVAALTAAGFYGFRHRDITS